MPPVSASHLLLELKPQPAPPGGRPRLRPRLALLPTRSYLCRRFRQQSGSQSGSLSGAAIRPNNEGRARCRGAITSSARPYKELCALRQGCASAHVQPCAARARARGEVSSEHPKRVKFLARLSGRARGETSRRASAFWLQSTRGGLSHPRPRGG